MVEYPELLDVKRRRRALGWTQPDLAGKAGTSQSLIAKMERGKLVPGYGIVCRILHSLSDAEAKLLGGKEAAAKDVMQKKVITVKPSDRMSLVSALAKKHSISQFPVIEAGRVVGALTTTAMIDAPKNASVKDAMTGPFPMVGRDATVKSLRQLVKDSGAVVVLKKNGQIDGIIAAENLI